MNNSTKEKNSSLSIKRKMLIELAIKVGDMSHDDVARLLHVTRQYIYKIVGKKE